MQISCKRFDCQKAVEVCFWSCKFRKNCKDWETALKVSPGAEAIRARLEESAKKSGRVFTPDSLRLPTKKKNRNSSLSSTGPLESRPNSWQAEVSRPGIQREPHHFKNRKQPQEIKGKMLNPSDSELDELDLTAAETPAPVSEKPASTKSKPKTAKPKPASKPVNNNGPIYLLLSANGKYKELRESELNSEAAAVLKDSSLRLIKGQYLVPQISFKVADEE